MGVGLFRWMKNLQGAVTDHDSRVGTPSQFILVDYEETCLDAQNERASKYMDPEHIFIAGDQSLKVRYIYERNSSLTAKVQFVIEKIKAFSSPVTLGFALFDMEFECYVDNCCGTRKYGRVKDFRKCTEKQGLSPC
ncbi:uncharacterized protein LOC135370214 [Ornithodoros turicata]|uniref:uncharacterized protein LOC135370214 n=1 Tax=Ornithodoros turicata TaxID=34597 RepID=UPI003139A908